MFWQKQYDQVLDYSGLAIVSLDKTLVIVRLDWINIYGPEGIRTLQSILYLIVKRHQNRLQIPWKRIIIRSDSWCQTHKYVELAINKLPQGQKWFE